MGFLSHFIRLRLTALLRHIVLCCINPVTLPSPNRQLPLGNCNQALLSTQLALSTARKSQQLFLENRERRQTERQARTRPAGSHGSRAGARGKQGFPGRREALAAEVSTPGWHRSTSARWGNVSVDPASTGAVVAPLMCSFWEPGLICWPWGCLAGSLDKPLSTRRTTHGAFLRPPAFKQSAKRTDGCSREQPMPLPQLFWERCSARFSWELLGSDPVTVVSCHHQSWSCIGTDVACGTGCPDQLGLWRGFALPGAHFSRDTSAGKKHHALLSHFYLLA